MPRQEWQKPNQTELFAFDRLSVEAFSCLKSYLAFPWATWIDSDKKGIPRISISPPAEAPLTRVRATVCQHIWALEYIDLFRQSGITDLFWSHASKQSFNIGDIRIHPFPLYPVRCASHPLTSPFLLPKQRKYLYSFQGTYSPDLYLTPVRQWLWELPSRPDACLEKRFEWHYEQAVYREQINGQSIDPVTKQRLDYEADSYVQTMLNSCFTLCPSGSGPNSIRLWESLGFGAIPVILSDTLALPGDHKLWHEAAIFISEDKSEVLRLPSLLESIASSSKRLCAMQSAGKKLWQQYGLSGFISDLRCFLASPMDFLTELALKRLPDDPSIVISSVPSELPLILHRQLKLIAADRPILIQINDESPFDLLEIRWGIALRICETMLEGRSWASVSLSPNLDRINISTTHSNSSS